MDALLIQAPSIDDIDTCIMHTWCPSHSFIFQKFWWQHHHWPPWQNVVPNEPSACRRFQWISLRLEILLAGSWFVGFKSLIVFALDSCVVGAVGPAFWLVKILKRLPARAFQRMELTPGLLPSFEVEFLRENDLTSTDTDDLTTWQLMCLKTQKKMSRSKTSFRSEQW